jgi:hypothetical protein
MATNIALRSERAALAFAVAQKTAALLPFRWITAAVFLGLTTIALVQRGMFMDGLLYVTVAHNQALGFGTFWEPRFSQEGFAGLPTFHEHPPLAFGMESLWFRVFGSGFWVEGLYSLCMAAATAWLLVLLWRSLWGTDRRLAALGWLPVLLWIIVPQVHWCAQNNMQENTMAVFTVAAVLMAVRTDRGTLHPAAGLALAGVFTFLAALVKGVPGLFPVCAPFLLAVVRGELWKGLWRSTLVTAIVVGLFALLMLWPEARQSLLTYAEGRLLHRIGMDPTVDTRWRIIPQFVEAMLGPLLLMLLARAATRRRRGADRSTGRQSATAMLLIGLCGVLPLTLTLVQKSFYMVAALPLVSTAIACMAAPSVAHLLERTSQGLRRGLLFAGRSAVLGVLVGCAVLFGKPSRDADLLRDVDILGQELPSNALVGVGPDLWEEWNLQSYLIRFHGVSVSSRPGGAWHLTAGEGMPPPGYRPVPLPTSHYRLWQRAEGTGPGR